MSVWCKKDHQMYIQPCVNCDCMEKTTTSGSSDFTALLSADIPEELYDGWAVYRELDEKAQQRTSAENISDVLDALVRLIKKRK